MTAEEKNIEQTTIAYAKAHRAKIARNLTAPKVFTPEVHPVSVFMAGSPGAGKTEASTELLNLKGRDGIKVLPIDPDELRETLPGYTGQNACLFQCAVMPIMEFRHDLALKQKQSFLLDGTLSSYQVAEKNIQRSLKRGRTVHILSIYQEPQQAWQGVRAREAAEGRRIQLDDFIRQSFAAREVVNRLKTELGHQIPVDLLMKNNDGSHRF